jgi:hypothetical protein
MSMCSYCYNEGHNRRTCQDLTAALERTVAARVAAGQAPGYAQAKLDGRGKGTGSTRAHRKCSFCGVRGHDRRTCLILKEYTSHLTDRDHQARHHIFEKMSDQKISPGALVQFTTKEWRGDDYKDQTYVGLVLDINWEKVGHRNYNSRCQILKVVYTNLKKQSQQVWVSPPAEVISIPPNLAEGLGTMSPRIEAECSVVIGPTSAPDKPAALLYKNCEKTVKCMIKESQVMVYHSQVHATLGIQRMEDLRTLQRKQDEE